ncbi:hypothetical protein PITC_021740 [Penicillium italicum]|uniref:Uncharacterized protein n=1 Tax=Penicillium italicum TaxID=40296 RepID=A0A0A2L1R4_PENIT|nr:hypothetical protein PITC_021740 [Penicillium italicum]
MGWVLGPRLGPTDGLWARGKSPLGFNGGPMGPKQCKYTKSSEVEPPFRGFKITIRFTPVSVTTSY